MNQPKRINLTDEQRNWMLILHLMKYFGPTAKQRLTVVREIKRCKREQRMEMGR